MPWMPGIPHDQGTCPQGTIRPLGVVAHRTYGSWGGDYSVGKGSNPPVGFHFLVGKQTGQWVQFYDSTTRCAHAGTNANGNDISVGIEVEGTNGEPMTPWQVDRVRDIVSWLKLTHNIALEYRFSTAHDLRADHGYIPHSAVKGAEHSDYWTLDDWNRITSGMTDVRKGDPDMILIQRKTTGEVRIVGLSDAVGIATPADRDELAAALRDPGRPAVLSDQTFEAIIKTA